MHSTLKRQNMQLTAVSGKFKDEILGIGYKGIFPEDGNTQGE